MSFPTRPFSAIVLLGGMLIGVVVPAAAAIPGPHPAYLHAMSDLRFARALLAVPEEYSTIPAQRRAIAHIDHALGDLRHAAYADELPVYEPQPVDVSRPRIDRVREATRALDRARADIERFESNGFAAGWRDAARRDIDAAKFDARIEANADRFDRDHDRM
jgi:hypothetical protein